jgi:hypothetical protein
VWLARTRFVLGDWPGALDAVNQAEVLLGATGLDLLRLLVHWTGAQVRALRCEQEPRNATCGWARPPSRTTPS